MMIETLQVTNYGDSSGINQWSALFCYNITILILGNKNPQWILSLGLKF